MITAAEDVEVIDLIAQTYYPVLRGGLVKLDTGHREVEHTCGTILQLHCHTILQRDIHTEQGRERLVDAHRRDVEHR